MQTVEVRDEVVIAAGKIGRPSDLEEGPAGKTRLAASSLARAIDGAWLVKTEEARLRIRLGHDQGVHAMAAADVRDRPSGFELRLCSIQRRNPGWTRLAS